MSDQQTIQTYAERLAKFALKNGIDMESTTLDELWEMWLEHEHAQNQLAGQRVHEYWEKHGKLPHE